VLAIKPPHTHGELKIDNQLTSLIQLPDTISSIMDWEVEFGAAPITHTESATEKVRKYHLYRWQRDAWETDYTGPIYEFDIIGSHYETPWLHTKTWLPDPEDQAH
jgi:hypothetical protein